MKDKSLAAQFAERLRKLEEREGLHSRDMADILSVGLERMLLLETGKALPGWEELRALSEYFHLSADYLLCLDGRDYLFLSSMTSEEARDFLYYLIPTLEEFFQSRHPISPSPL